MAATSAINGHSHANGDNPKIMLYTNHGCPYAHRAHITLNELGLPFEETLIDLTVPRPQWYLDDINPRGLVPSIKFSLPFGKSAAHDVSDSDSKGKEVILTESEIVSRFLCDAYPSHLLPSSTEDPLRRARIHFFTDTWGSKVSSAIYPVVFTSSPEQREEKADALVAVITKEIEPLLADAKPFFGGSEKLTFAEVMAAPQLVRVVTLAEDGEFVPRSMLDKLEALPNFSRWMRAVKGSESVQRQYNEEVVLDAQKKMIKKRIAAANA